MKDTLMFTARCGEGSLDVKFSSRELKFLAGRHLPEGRRFIAAIGMFDGFTVRGGQDVKNWVAKSRTDVLDKASLLLNRISDDREWLGFDYSYSLSAEPGINQSGAATIRINGTWGMISATCPGELFFDVDGEPTIDLRRLKTIQTDEKGLLKVHRRRNKISWHLKLPALIDFLAGKDAEIVEFRYGYNKD